jgi:hypothetical protein
MGNGVSSRFGPVSINVNAAGTVQIIPVCCELTSEFDERSGITRRMRNALVGTTANVKFVRGHERRAHGRNPLVGVRVNQDDYPAVMQTLEIKPT